MAKLPSGYITFIKGNSKGTEAVIYNQKELILCKDCKYFKKHMFFGTYLHWCERLCDEFDHSMSFSNEPDGYCNFAEREDDVCNTEQEDE